METTAPPVAERRIIEYLTVIALSNGKCDYFMVVPPGKEVKQMKLSARNQLKGKITDVKEGPVSTEVTVTVGDVKIVSSITTGSARQMKLAVDDDAFAVIKASSVMIAKE